MSKRKKAGFRFNAKKVGLTYSCPVDKDDNPVPDVSTLRDELLLRVGMAKYIVSEEKHESGKRHYHVYLHTDVKIDTTDSRFFDVNEVHPNVINKPGAGWMAYVKKDNEYITNIESGPYATALTLTDAKAALEHLWTVVPKDMALHGVNIERNITTRMAPPLPTGKVWFGPYPEKFYPIGWNADTHALLLTGPPGLNKTQFAKYYLHGASYIKKDPERIRNLDFSKPFIFDEVYMLDRNADDSREITDVVDGGTIGARYSGITIPPGVQRIFISNYAHPFKNPNESVYGRRVFEWNVPAN